MPKGSLIIVSAAYAKHFKPAPKDGHTYMVQDPMRPWVHHMTKPDGTYVVLDKTCPRIAVEKKRTKYLNGKPKKKAPRHAAKLTVGVTLERQPEEPPVIRLIGIDRVMEIVGFKKSFIYEQPDFPEPIRLTSSRRGAVRWVSSEVELWVQKLMAKRSTAAAIASQSGSAMQANSHRPQILKTTTWPPLKTNLSKLPASRCAASTNWHEPPSTSRLR